jgi:Fe-S-cluster containining protein
MVNICIGCGLCCDGTMFSCVDLYPQDDQKSLSTLALSRKSTDGTIQFLQPCAASTEGCCAIYESRPTACRNYRCELRIKYDAGAVSLSNAQAAISDAISLRDKVRGHRDMLEKTAQAEQPYSLDRLYQLVGPKLHADVELRRAHAELLLDMIALNRTLAKHFRPRRAEPREDTSEVMK